MAKYFGKFVLRVSLYSSAVASHGCRAFDPVLTALGSDLLDSPKIPYDSHKHKITCFFCLAPSWAGVAVTTFHPARCIGLLGSSCFHVVTNLAMCAVVSVRLRKSFTVHNQGDAFHFSLCLRKEGNENFLKAVPSAFICKSINSPTSCLNQAMSTCCGWVTVTLGCLCSDLPSPFPFNYRVQVWLPGGVHRKKINSLSIY